MRHKIYPIIFLILTIAVSIFLHFRSENIADSDSFYHFRHADIYRRSGLMISEFPWIAYSVIKEFASDIWYGFHVFLIPFTFLKDQVLGIKIAGTFLTATLLIILYWSLAKLKVSKKYFWPFLALFAAPNVLFHFAMTRPHILSTAFAILLFAFLARGGIIGVFLTSFVSSFAHLGLIWMVLFVFGVTALAKFFAEK